MNEQEQILRENIRHLIKHVKQKKLDEEKEVKKSLQALIKLELKNMLNESQTPDNDPSPNKSTGINVLEDLLKKIIPVFRDDFKLMTTDEEQRDSFRAHVVKAIVDTLTPVETNNQAPSTTSGVNEDVEIDIVDQDEDAPDPSKLIDIGPVTDSELKAAEEEEDPRDEFGKGLENADKTGRNMAYNTFKKVANSVIDSYELLDNPEDQEIFYDYLIANTKLYFDKFEDDLSPTVKEPTNQAYQMAKDGEDKESELSPTPQDASFPEPENASPMDSLTLSEEVLEINLD